MLVTPIHSRIFTAGEDLLSYFLGTGTILQDGDIVVITSKIVALAQNRIVSLADFGETEEKALHALIKQEANKVYPGKYALTLTEGILIPFAGIDVSNVPEGKAVLWPKDVFEYAKSLQEALTSHFHLQKLGVIISDSQCHPLRVGVIGLALGWYGFLGIEDERGRNDLYGKPLKITRKAVADNLASSAMMTQGEADESCPIALIKDAPVCFTNVFQKNESKWEDANEDIFASILRL